MNRVVILIIAHKAELNDVESASLLQCYKVLGKHRIVFICPEGLNISGYQKLVADAEFCFIDPKWQSTYRMFNRLKIAPLLYRQFRDYEYVLFYELDAWVFRDDLIYWCDQGYDYIGAPWFKGFLNVDSNTEFLGVGNGGFSLRKVESHLRVLRSFAYCRTPAMLWEKFMLQPSFSAMVKVLANLTIRNNTFYPFNTWHRNEDYFWGKISSERFAWFKVPTMEKAAAFSMELNAPMLYDVIGGTLPFGCHKWELYHQDFWKQFINPEARVG